MCGRYNLRLTSAELQQVFQLIREPEWEPRSNICPSQMILGIRFDADATPREPVLMKWGYLPVWAQDRDVKPQPINAKAENITGRMWGSAFRRHRCLIPATSFYEWQARPGGGKKQPMDIALENGEPFAFAGLWSRWERGDDQLETCAIITTSANEAVEPIHDRMPVILQAQAYDLWIDPGTKPQMLTKLLRPYEGPMRVTAVDSLVPRNNGR